MNTEEIKDNIEGKAELAKALRDISVELYNKDRNPAKALDAIGRACSMDPENSLYLYERDCLLEEVGADPMVRLSMLEDKKEVILKRDDLTFNYAHVLNLNGRIDEAADLLLGREFALDLPGQIRLATEYKKTLLTMAAREASEGNSDRALVICELSFTYPKGLGISDEIKVPDNMGWFMIGDIHMDRSEDMAAADAFEKAAEGDEEPKLLSKETDVSSEHIYYQALAKARLGQKKEALDLMRKLMDFGNEHMNDEPEENAVRVRENEAGSYIADPKKKNEEYCKRLISLGVRGLGEIE